MRQCATVTGVLTLGLAVVSPLMAATAAHKLDAQEFFETRIRPVLADNCFTCHGAADQRGGIRLDSRQAIVGGPGGPVAIPGHPEQSRLIQAISYGGPIKMPPAAKLDSAQIRDLTAWVQEGAPWPAAGMANSPVVTNSPAGIRTSFWSFQPVSETAPPTVKDKAWPSTPIDRFILSRLEAVGLHPAPRADRRALIRRATYDLTGLPPTPEETEAFLADRSPAAFARVVDRLLASPRYGERWGRRWLDVVRYCDSLDSRGLGTEGDISEAWRYRDWVVEAFNRDLPYNRFVMDQIAGDLLPAEGQGGQAPRLGRHLAAYRTGGSPGLPFSPAAPEAVQPLYLRGAGQVNARGIIATGMLAIGNWGNGDADKEKILTDIADDQVDVVSRGFMGLTVACARCHDHKFDPIPTRDYYGLAGIFFSTHILPGLAPKGSGETLLRIPLLSPAELEERQQSTDRAAALEKRITAQKEENASELVRSLAPRTADYLAAAWEYVNHSSPSLDSFAAARGLKGYALRRWIDALIGGDYRLMTTPVRDLLGNGGVDLWKGDSDTPAVTVNTNSTPRTILTFTLPPRSLSVHPGPTNGVVVSWRSPITGVVRITGSVADADPACGDGVGWIIDWRSRSGYRELASGDFPNGGQQAFEDGVGASQLSSVPVRAGELIQLLVLPKATYACDTTVVRLQIIQQGGSHRWDVTQDVLDTFHEGGNPHPDAYQNPGVWGFYDMAESGRSRVAPGPLAEARDRWLKAVAAAKNGDGVRAASAEFAKSFTALDATSPFWTTDPQAFPPGRQEELIKLGSELDVLKKTLSTPVVYANGAQEGGVPGSPQAGFHDVRIHIRGSYARLGDVAPRHFPLVLGGALAPPITDGSGRLELARWIASPANPLTARVMVNRIWEGHFGEGLVRTPGNFGKLGDRPTHPELLDYLASQFVKSGWSIKKMHRMIMLSAVYQQSSMASPTVMKKDPDNRLLGRMSRQRLDAEALRDTFLAVSGRLDVSEGGPAYRDLAVPRRTLYLMTIRSDRSGYRSLFDAADSSAIIDRRNVTTVAPQALFLMNSPFARDSARALAKRLALEMGRDDAGRIRRAYQVLYGRPAEPAEIAIGQAYLAGTRRSAGHESAQEADDRAWLGYCQILLCANELIYID